MTLTGRESALTTLEEERGQAIADEIHAHASSGGEISGWEREEAGARP